MEKLKAFMHGIDFIPFVLAAGNHIRLSPARILEAVIIAGVTGGVVLYGANMVLSTKVDQIIKVSDQQHNETLLWRGYVQDEINKNRDRIFLLSGHKAKDHE